MLISVYSKGSLGLRYTSIYWDVTLRLAPSFTLWRLLKGAIGWSVNDDPGIFAGSEGDSTFGVAY